MNIHNGIKGIQQWYHQRNYSRATWIFRAFIPKKKKEKKSQFFSLEDILEDI